MKWDKTRLVGTEFSKNYVEYIENGFMDKYLSGDKLLDIGSTGYETGRTTFHENAIGLDKGFPGYDLVNIPFPDGQFDGILASHILEHVPNENLNKVIQEWYRVLKRYKYMVITVPHQFLYERKKDLPSIWNADHKRFYTPAKLLAEFENALEPNSYRIELCRDNAEGWNKKIPPTKHAGGKYEIILVLQKIGKPSWSLL